MVFAIKNIERTWQNWATAKEIAEQWQVTSRRVRQIIEKVSHESATLVHKGQPTIVYKMVK